MRQVFNVVSGGILLGLSLLAITILTALYATPWQASTIFAVIAGVISSVSLYFGSQVETRALAQRLEESQLSVQHLEANRAQDKAVTAGLEEMLRQAQERLRQAQEQQMHLEHDVALRDSLLRDVLLHDALLVVQLVFVLEPEAEEEPPLFI